MMRTAGSAKVAKKEVAPAILSGSFFLNSLNDLPKRGRIRIILWLILI
jgi:hypothetical protein